MIPDLAQLWSGLVWPLCRLLMGMSAGLFLASILESLKWTDFLSRLAMPLTRAARLNPLAASSFALAAISPASANAFLAENFDQGRISRLDLFLANLFNSLPSNLAHLPTIFFLVWPVLGPAAIAYVGISFLAAMGRTVFILFLSRLMPGETQMPMAQSRCQVPPPRHKFTIFFKKSLSSACQKFYRRLPRLFCYTIPFYMLVYFMTQAGFFASIEKWLAAHLSWLVFIKAQAMSIIILQIIAEMGASLGAAGALLENGELDAHDIVLAMLVGNILATPMRAIRHQFPSYAGFFKPVLALELLVANQALRAASMIIALLIYASL